VGADQLFDDGQSDAGTAVVPAAIAIAEQIGGLDGRTLLTAVALATDVEGRMLKAVANVGASGWNSTYLYAAFGAAMAAGLKITERYPHAYPVKYYNPQGFDATVYPPHPDLKFINDTPNYILLQAKIDGTKLTFEIYGTSDGRQVSLVGPKILYANTDGSMKTIMSQQIWRNGQMQREDFFPSLYRSPNLYPHPMTSPAPSPSPSFQPQTPAPSPTP